MTGNALNLTTTVGFSPADLFQSAISLASNYYPFLIIGLSFFITPWIFDIVIAAVKAYHFSSSWNKYDAPHFGIKTSFLSEFKKEYSIRRYGEYDL